MFQQDDTIRDVQVTFYGPPIVENEPRVVYLTFLIPFPSLITSTKIFYLMEGDRTVAMGSVEEIFGW